MYRLGHGSSNGLSADSVKKLILAAMKAQGTVSKSKGEKKAVLAAAVAAAKDLKKKTGGTRLPDGVRCKRGTCTFNHDETAPDSPCYRDPEWEGPLPKRIREDKEQLGRVIKDREENAKRLGKTCKRLLEGDATSANLVDMLDELETGVFMLDTEQLFEELDDSQLDDGRTVTPGERRGSMDVMDIASELLSADSGAMTQPTLFDTPGGRATDAIVLCDVGSAEMQKIIAVESSEPVEIATDQLEFGDWHDFAPVQDSSSTRAGPAPSSVPVPRALAFSPAANSEQPTPTGPDLQSQPAAVTLQKTWLQIAEAGGIQVAPSAPVAVVTVDAPIVLPPQSPVVFPCVRDECPCLASWNGQQGEYCCLTCYGGKPCLQPYHTVPFKSGAAAVTVPTPNVPNGACHGPNRAPFAPPCAHNISKQIQPEAQDVSVRDTPKPIAIPSVVAEVYDVEVQDGLATPTAAPSRAVVSPPLVDASDGAIEDSSNRFAEIAVAAGMVAVIMTMLLCGMYGSGMLYHVLLFAISMVSTRGHAALAFDSDSGTSVLSTARTPHVSLMAFLMTAGASIFIANAMANAGIIKMMMRLSVRAVRVIRTVANVAVDVQAHRHRAGQLAGSMCVLACVFMMLTGAGASETRHETAYLVARNGADLVPGAIGQQARFFLDELGMKQLNVTRVPVFISSADVSRLSVLLNQTGTEFDVGDSGAAVHVLKSTKGCVPGSVRENTLAVHTANGTVVPPFRCDKVRRLRCDDGSFKSVILRDCLVMEQCAHNLISLGRLARDEGITTTNRRWMRLVASHASCGSFTRAYHQCRHSRCAEC